MHGARSLPSICYKEINAIDQSINQTNKFNPIQVNAINTTSSNGVIIHDQILLNALNENETTSMSTSHAKLLDEKKEKKRQQYEAQRTTISSINITIDC